MEKASTIPSYLQSSIQFIEHRLAYYTDCSPTTDRSLRAKIQTGSDDDICKRRLALDRLAGSKTDIVIVTATKNRPKGIQTAAGALLRQKGPVDWKWVVIDNGKDKETNDVISELNDERVLHVPFTEVTGCAYPVRNFGLDIVHSAFLGGSETPYVLVVDSDDRLAQDFSLHELLKLTRSSKSNKFRRALVHGYSASEIHEGNNITHVPNPRNWDSSFPEVNSLSDFYDKGLNILGGMIPIDVLDWLRYPSEFSFEDDGFNQKLILQAKRMKQDWVAEIFPSTVKIFHEDSMTGKNNEVGDLKEVGKIGLHQATGIRARIIGYLKDITDYYQREQL